MKTSKQLSEEVLEKISRKNEERVKMKKRLQKVTVAVVIVGVLLPTSVYLGTTETFDKNTPLSKPLEQSEQLPSSEEDSSYIAPGFAQLFDEMDHTNFM